MKLRAIFATIALVGVCALFADWKKKTRHLKLLNLDKPYTCGYCTNESVIGYAHGIGSPGPGSSGWHGRYPFCQKHDLRYDFFHLFHDGSNWIGKAYTNGPAGFVEGTREKL